MKTKNKPKWRLFVCDGLTNGKWLMCETADDLFNHIREATKRFGNQSTIHFKRERWTDTQVAELPELS